MVNRMIEVSARLAFLYVVRRKGSHVVTCYAGGYYHMAGGKATVAARASVRALPASSV